jgi:hypothetical protein
VIPTLQAMGGIVYKKTEQLLTDFAGRRTRKKIKTWVKGKGDINSI